MSLLMDRYVRDGESAAAAMGRQENDTKNDSVSVQETEAR